MSAAYYEEYWAREQPPPLDDPLAPKRRALLRTLAREVGATSALDVGCGHGELVGVLAAEGIAAVGMDVAAGAVEAARRALPECRFVQHSVEEVPWPVEAGAFDVVATFEVIEHLLEPRRLLVGAREALRPGGYLALTTPYHGRVKNLALALAAFDRHFDVEGDHIRFFTDRALEQLLTDTGFTTLRVVHFGRGWPLWAGSFVWARRAD